MKVAVIGGGPGGYECAIVLAQQNQEVTLIEKNKVGGTCLNVGCIPTKALLHAAKQYSEAKKSSQIGIDTNPVLNFAKVMEYKNRTVSKLVKGVEGLLKVNNVEVVNGLASFKDKNTLLIKTNNGIVERSFDKVVIATGSYSFIPPIEGIKDIEVSSSEEALSFESVPESLVIIGGGVIGVEFAEIYKSFGTKVTIIEALDSLLYNIDREITDIYTKKIKNEGVDVFTSCKVLKVAKNNDDYIVEFDDNGETKTVISKKLLISTGRKPNTVNLNLDEIGVKTNRGFVEVDFNTMKTSVDNIYAIGDIVPSIQLAHVASHEGIIAANDICGKCDNANNSIVPSCVYCNPEISSVGVSEQEANKNGLDIVIGRFPMMANGRSLIEGDSKGLVKVIADRNTRKILGVSMICPFASEIISEAAIAIYNGNTIDDIDRIIHAHPTIYEALHEACLDADGKAINNLSKKI